MVLQVNVTDDEMREFFTRNGYSVASCQKGRWVHRYHNKAEWVETTVLGVVAPSGRVVEAAPIFQAVAESKLKRIIAPANLETKRYINKLLK